MLSVLHAACAQAEALAEFTDVQMALNLHVNEEVRHRTLLQGSSQPQYI